MSSTGSVYFNREVLYMYGGIIGQLQKQEGQNSISVQLCDGHLDRSSIGPFISNFPIIHPEYSNYRFTQYTISQKRLTIDVENTLDMQQRTQYREAFERVARDCGKKLQKYKRYICADYDKQLSIYSFVKGYFAAIPKMCEKIQDSYNNFPAQVLNFSQSSYCQCAMYKLLLGRFLGLRSHIVQQTSTQRCVLLHPYKGKYYVTDVDKDVYIKEVSESSYAYFMRGYDYLGAWLNGQKVPEMGGFKISEVASEHYESMVLKYDTTTLPKAISKWFLGQTPNHEQHASTVYATMVVPEHRKDTQYIRQCNLGLKLLSLNDKLDYVLEVQWGRRIEFNNGECLYILQIQKKATKMIRFQDKDGGNERSVYNQLVYNALLSYIEKDPRLRRDRISICMLAQGPHGDARKQTVRTQTAFMVQDLQAHFQDNINYSYAFSETEQQLLTLTLELSFDKGNAHTTYHIEDSAFISPRNHFAYYTQLSNTAQCIKYILSAAQSLRSYVYIPTHFWLTDEKHKQIMHSITLDYPEYWFVAVNEYQYNTTDDGTHLISRLSLIKTQFSPEWIVQVNQKLVKQIGHYMKQRDIRQFDLLKKEYYLHSILQHTVVYKTPTEEEEATTLSRNIIGCFVVQKCVCKAVALGFKYLCDIYGIRCIVVSGFAQKDSAPNGCSTSCGNDMGTGNATEEEGHAWNMVELDGEYYHVDPTWNLGENKLNEHFNVDDAFSLSRKRMKADNWIKYPKCQKMTKNYYNINGAYINSAEEALSRTIQILARKLKRHPENRTITLFYNIKDGFDLSKWISNNKRNIINSLLESKEVGEITTLRFTIYDKHFLRYSVE